MSKENISATVDPEVQAYLNRDAVNASGLINKLVKQQMYCGEGTDQLLQLRLEQINSQIEQLNSQIESLEKERQQVKTRLEEMESQRDATLAEAKDALADVPKEPTNAGIQNWADKLSMTPKQLIERLEDE